MESEGEGVAGRGRGMAWHTVRGEIGVSSLRSREEERNRYLVLSPPSVY